MGLRRRRQRQQQISSAPLPRDMRSCHRTCLGCYPVHAQRCRLLNGVHLRRRRLPLRIVCAIRLRAGGVRHSHLVAHDHAESAFGQLVVAALTRAHRAIGPGGRRRLAVRRRAIASTAYDRASATVGRRYLNEVSGTHVAEDHAADAAVMLATDEGEWRLAGIAVLAEVVRHPMLLAVVDDDGSPPSSLGPFLLPTGFILPVGGSLAIGQCAQQCQLMELGGDGRGGGRERAPRRHRRRGGRVDGGGNREGVPVPALPSALAMHPPSTGPVAFGLPAPPG